MERIAVVVDRVQCLQRGADIVEVDLLRMQGAAGCLYMVFQFLRAVVPLVFILHGLGPDPSCHTPDHAVFGIHAVTKEEGKVGGEVVDVHTPAQVIFHIGKSIGQCKGKLGDGVGTRLCDMITADADAVEVLHFMLDEELLHITHQFECEFGAEDAGVLRLVFFEYVCLHRAPYGRQGPCLDLRIYIRRQHILSA